MMKKKLILFLIITCAFLCTANAASKKKASDEAKQIVGTWVEDPNRVGNKEIGHWNKDGSFAAEVYTQEGVLTETDTGTWCIEDGLLKLTITELGGDWNGGKLEPCDPIIMYYKFTVTKDKLHTERVKRVMNGAEETFNPAPEDNYVRN